MALGDINCGRSTCPRDDCRQNQFHLCVSPLIEAGNVYLPHPQLAPWVNDLIEECAAFPNGAHDDQVDAMTQALLRWNMVPYQPAAYYRELPEISPI